MLTKSSIFKCCTSVVEDTCSLWVFYSSEFYLVTARMYLALFVYTGKVQSSLVKLKIAWKTHCLSHNIQCKTGYLSKFLEKLKIWDCHSSICVS